MYTRHEFHPMNTAPRDGQSILAYWWNDCFWEAEVVWWSSDRDYPWAGRFPEDKFDLWVEIDWPTPVPDGWPV